MDCSRLGSVNTLAPAGTAAGPGTAEQQAPQQAAPAVPTPLQALPIPEIVASDLSMPAWGHFSLPSGLLPAAQKPPSGGLQGAPTAFKVPAWANMPQVVRGWR